MENYFNKLNKNGGLTLNSIGGIKSETPKSKFANSLSINSALTPASNVGATSTKPAVISPAKEKFVQSQIQQPQAEIQPQTNNVTTPSGAVVNSQTGATISTPQPNPQDNYRSAFDSYLKSLTGDDENIQKSANNLANLQLKSKMDEDRAYNMTGVTSDFAGREVQAANRENAFGIEAETNRLNALTGAKTARTDASKARLDFEKGLLADEASGAKTKFDQDLQSKKFEEDKRQFGLDYALKQKDVAINQQKANQASVNPNGFSGTLSPLAQAVQNGTITIDKIPMAQRAQIAAELATSGIPTSRQQALSSNLEAVNALLDNENIGKISGFIQGKLKVGNLQPDAQLALNQYNQIKGILSLENREKLKGSGAISDFEFKVLSDAATSLGRNLSDKDFKAQLQKVKDVFEGKYALTNATSKQTEPQPITAPDGLQVIITD